MDGGRLVVSDDPDGTIATLLEYAANDSSLAPSAFGPEGDGYAAPSIVCVIRLTKQDDIPLEWDEHIPFDPDVWIIFKDRKDQSGMHVAWLHGDELRALFTEARRIQS